MKKFGHNFWMVFLPFHLLALFGIFYIIDYWLELLILWFIIGVIGNGVAAHKYFAHGQFETWLPVKWLLGILATLAAIGPLTYWTIQHKLHHLNSDDQLDPHSPKNDSAWKVFYSWTFPQGSNEKQYLQHKWAKKLAIQQMRDPFFVFFHNNHYRIIYLFSFILLLVDPILLMMYCLAYAIDFFRLGAINYWCHKSGYRNHRTNDESRNNIWLGWLGMGFGWHNTHHAHPGKLILTEKWWEIDLEGIIAYLLSKK